MSLDFVPQQSSQYPGYVLSAASLVPSAGVVVGSSAGNIHLVKTLSSEPQTISTMDSIPGQVKYIIIKGLSVGIVITKETREPVNRVLSFCCI